MVSATVPTEEEIARVIYEDRNGRGCVPWSRRDSAHKAPYLSDARAVLALFAPVLAEKKRERDIANDAREAHAACTAALIAAAEGQLDAVEKAIGVDAVRFMDPPDGGCPTLAEMVANMRQQLDAAEARAIAAEAALAELRKQMLADEGQHREALAAERERCAKIADARNSHHCEDDWEIGSAQSAEAIAAAIRAQPLRSQSSGTECIYSV